MGFADVYCPAAASTSRFTVVVNTAASSSSPTIPAPPEANPPHSPFCNCLEQDTSMSAVYVRPRTHRDIRPVKCDITKPGQENLDLHGRKVRPKRLYLQREARIPRQVQSSRAGLPRPEGPIWRQEGWRTLRARTAAAR